MTRKIRHGSVWLANLNPRRGTEPGKTRPVLIFQNQDLIDAGHPSAIIIPLSTKLIDDAEPLRLRVTARESLKKESDLLVDQIRAIDIARLTKGPLAQLNDKFMEKVQKAAAEVMGFSFTTPTQSLYI